jgi:hypothetical protein
MTHQPPTLTLRRESLMRALCALPALDVSVLLHLVSHACARTNRVWTSPGRTAEALSLTSGVVEHAFLNLEREHFLLNHRVRGDLRCLELGPLLVREGEPPDNLPVESL